jgi:hypothetical protein
VTSFGDSRSAREESSGLFPEVLREVSAIFGLHFPGVLESYRDLEALTAERAFASRQNLLEALSHLAVLFGRAGALDREEQLAQVAHMSDHLRRVLMEGFEKQAYLVLGAIRTEGDEGEPSLDTQYKVQAAPLIRAGKLNGFITPDEVEARFDSALRRLSRARGTKVADGSWDEWEEAAAEMGDVAVDLRDLRRDLGAAVDAANELATSKRHYWGAILYGGLVGAILAVGLGTLIAWLT